MLLNTIAIKCKGNIQGISRKFGTREFGTRHHSAAKYGKNTLAGFEGHDE